MVHERAVLLFHFNKSNTDKINMNNSIPITEDSATETPNKVDQYSVIKNTEEIGYYSERTEIPIRISNFYVNLFKCNKGCRDKGPFAYYEGEVVLPDNVRISFDSLPASHFAEPSSLHKYIENLCGPKAIIHGSLRELVKAIKLFNMNAEEFEEREFGYNDELTSYYTGNMIIGADGISEKNTPIKFSENWGNNKLGFKATGTKSLEEIKNSIIEKLLEWDKPEIMCPLLSYSLYPVIYPFLKDKNPNKFYLMLKGPSGSGKSQMSKWMQSFYGDFHSLFSWTSTDTSIHVTGMAFKDAVFAVDDLKQQNFRSENDIKKIQGLMQNYSDGSSRQRSMVDLRLRDERTIKGHLLISAEDLVFAESSTIARGVIIGVESKPCKKHELSEIDDMAKDFQSFTPYLIQHILKNCDKAKVAKIFDESHDWISNQSEINDSDISHDNLPRLKNNFAAIKTSWTILSEFLYSEKFGSEQFTEIFFNESLIKLLLENIKRISDFRPDAVFESALWEMLENGTFTLQKVLNNGNLSPVDYSSIVVGHYYINPNNDPRLVINIRTALRELIKRIPNFSISADTLISKFKTDGKIAVNPSGKASLNSQKVRGVYWIGEFPLGIIGLKEVEDPVTLAKAILKEKEEVNFPF